MVYAVFALLVFQGWEVSTASGQGLFGRLRARIDSRRQATPPQSPAQPRAANQPRVTPQPQVAPQPQANQPGGRASTRNDLRAATPSAPGQGRAVETSRAGDVPMFGIDVSPARIGAYQGLQVLGFSSDSGATRAGLRLGDVIVSIGGVRTGALADVTLAQSKLNPGQQTEMQVVRGGRIYRVQVPVGVSGSRASGIAGDDSIASFDSKDPTLPRVAAKPPVGASSRGNSADGPTLARPRSSLGLEVRNATPKRGIEVVIVREATAGKIGGLKPQDRIVSVEGRLVKDIDGMIRELALSQPGDEVLFGVVRGESMLELNIEMGGPGGKPIQSATAKRSESPPSGMPARRDDGSNAGPSLLNGMGAALGGFFAGGDADKDGQSEPKEQAAAAKKGSFSGELMAPAQPSVPVDPSADPLALPDDEASFDKRSGVDVLPTPQPIEPADEVSEVERLRAEVKRLRAALDQ